MGGDLEARVSAVFKQALAAHHLVYTQSFTVNSRLGSINVLVRCAPALNNKLQQDNSTQGNDTEAKSNPFLHPDPNLIIAHRDNHLLVMNKFCVVANHFMLITKGFCQQHEYLNDNDLNETYSCLQQYGQRLLAFHNCGTASGASQPHRHIQFIPIPNGFKPFPDDIRRAASPSYHPDMPVAHFILRINPQNLSSSYKTLISRAREVAKACGQSIDNAIHHNLLMCEDWMMIVPRRNPKWESIGVNGTGMIGLFLVKSETEKCQLLEMGVGVALKHLGIPLKTDVPI